MNFEKLQNFNFSVSHFKITTNSFTYSLVEQFLETHFHKNNYRGILLGKNLPNFSSLYTPYLGEGYIIRAANVPIILRVDNRTEFENNIVNQFDLREIFNIFLEIVIASKPKVVSNRLRTVEIFLTFTSDQ